MKIKFRSTLVLICCGLYFVLAGLLLMPYPGFQHDEAIFAQPIFQRGLAFYSYRIGHLSVPLMTTSYAGTLKTFIYWPIFKLWNPSAYSLRIPSLLIAALSILLLWPIMLRAGGRRAAGIATILLATDTMYLLTSVFDWGPVALQHLFLVAVMLASIRYHVTGKPWLLALAAYLVGTALWDKALFFWLLGGLTIGTLFIFPQAFWRRFCWRNLLIAAASLSIGGLPLIFYNIHRTNSTLSDNATLSTERFEEKLQAANHTVNASAMFGYIVFDDWVPPPRPPRTALESASLALRRATVASHNTVMLWAYGVGLLLAPLAWRTPAWRPMLFALIFSATGWTLMLLTKGAGGSVHHVILLWPVPLMFLALSFSEASRKIPTRFALAALSTVIGIFAFDNILVTNQYLARLIRNGPTPNWTNALYPLSSALLTARYREVVGIDWSTVVPLRVLERAAVPLNAITVDPSHPEQLLGRMGSDSVVFVGHVTGREAIAGVNSELEAIARGHGFAKQVIRTFADENGRPIFELFQYRPTKH